MNLDPNDVPDLSPVSEIHAFESGKYRMLARLGEGGMAEVYLTVARGPAGFNKLVVIKRLKSDLARNSEYRAMFLDEARLAARLSHPNVVQTYEVSESDSAFFMTMEYLEGQPLSRVMRALDKSAKKLPHRVHAHLCAEALAGLHYAHELCDFDGSPLKIVHRDVSPQNMFVTYDGQVKLVDFGIAKAEMSSSKTQAGTLKGKASYMAPEQVVGSCDRRADLFAMGIVLWELVTGRRLMTGESMAQTLWRVVRDPVPKPSDFVSDLSPALEAIIMRALSRDPEQRYQSAKQMRDALVEYIEKTGYYVRQDEIAALMQEVFGKVRAHTQARIKEKMAERSGPVSGYLATDSIAGMQLATPLSSISLEAIERSAVAKAVPDPRSRLWRVEVRHVRWIAATLASFMVVVGGAYATRRPAARAPVEAPPLETSTSTLPPEPAPSPSIPPPPVSTEMVSAKTIVTPAAPPSSKPMPRPVWRPPPPHPVAHDPPPATASAPPPPSATAEKPVAPAPSSSAAPAASPQGRRIRTEL